MWHSWSSFTSPAQLPELQGEPGTEGLRFTVTSVKKLTATVATFPLAQVLCSECLKTESMNVFYGAGMGGCAEKQLKVNEGQRYGFPIWLCLHSNHGSNIYSMTLEEWYMLFKASVSSSEKQRLNRLWASKLLRRSVCRVWGESETYGSDTKQCKMFLFM